MEGKTVFICSTSRSVSWRMLLYNGLCLAGIKNSWDLPASWIVTAIWSSGSNVFAVWLPKTSSKARFLGTDEFSLEQLKRQTTFQATNSYSGLRQKKQAFSYMQAEENCSHFISVCDLGNVTHFSNIFSQLIWVSIRELTKSIDSSSALLWFFSMHILLKSEP